MDDKPHKDLDDRLEALDQHIESLSKHLHTAAKAKGEGAICQIPCPACGSKMEPGKLRLHAGILALAIFPYGEHCWFQPDGGGEEMDGNVAQRPLALIIEKYLIVKLEEPSQVVGVNSGEVALIQSRGMKEDGFVDVPGLGSNLFQRKLGSLDNLMQG